MLEFCFRSISLEQMDRITPPFLLKLVAISKITTIAAILKFFKQRRPSHNKAILEFFKHDLLPKH